MNNDNKNEAVAYNGHCAFAVSTGKLDVQGGNHSHSIDGKTYMFSNAVAKMLFRILPNRIEKADQNWK
jgi:YHS domain-containing protein